MKKYILALVILNACMANVTHAQVITANQFESKAEIAYEAKDYNAALAYYQSILTDDSERADLFWKAAESARMTRHFKTAEQFYELLSKKQEWANAQPLLDFRLASMKKCLEKYDAAIALYQKHIAASGQMSAEALNEISQIKWAQEQLKTPKAYEVEHLKESTKVNTPYIDAAPVQYGTTLYYREPEDAPGDACRVARRT